MEEMKILCCGSRAWNNWPLIWSTLKGLGPNTVIIHGDARGADKMCGFVGKQLGYLVRPYPADWNGLGKSAGPVRNRQMFDLEQPKLVLAFKNLLEEEVKRYLKGERGMGTADMICYAREKGCPVNVIEEENAKEKDQG